MASKRSFMPMYWGDYLADTAHLSTTQHGAYLLLIGRYWTAGKPPDDDDAQLSRTARMSAAAWAGIRPVLAELFEIRDGKWFHKRIEAELSHAAQRYAQRAEGARIANAKRDAQRTDSERIAPRSAHAERVAQLQPQPQSLRRVPVADATGAAAPGPLDLKGELWKAGRAFLAKHGFDREAAGKLLGKWRQSGGDVAVINALAAAEAECAQDVVPFIEACLKRGKNGKSGQPVEDRSAFRGGLARAALARVGPGEPAVPDDLARRDPASVG